jgi:hypothetical protein
VTVYKYALERYTYGQGSEEPEPQALASPSWDHNEDTESGELPHGVHGTSYMYRWGRCRCWECREAKATSASEYRKKLKNLSTS